MKKLFVCLVAFAFGSSVLYGYDTVYQQSDEAPGLTPRRTQPPVPPVPVPVPYYPAAASQVVVAPVAVTPVATVAHRTVYEPVVSEPVPVSYDPAVSTGFDSYSHIYGEMERMNDAITKLQKDTAKPDTKKAWSAPKISGRIFLDSVNFMNQNDESRLRNGNMQNAAGFRELRLGAAGTGYDSFDYKVEFGFQSDAGRVALVDNWVGVKNVPLLGYVRIGHFKPETGQYYSMGTTNVSTMEYITPANVFGLGRRIGIASENLFANDRVRLFFGVFQNEATDMDRRSKRDNQGQVVNLRLTAAPWFEQEGKYLFHVGGHWSYVSTHNGRDTRSVTPGTFSWGDTSLSSGAFDTEYSNRGGLELAYQCGRFSARSELFAGSFDGGEHLYGSYVELGYFLTNDFRTYDLKSGLFGAPKMKRNFHPYKHGEWNLIDSWGAWQAVFQWGYTDMEDWRRAVNTTPAGGVATTSQYGGHQNDFVAGLNWYWSPQMRWMFQYVRSEQCVGNAYSHRSQDIFGTSVRYNW